jgi:gamma-glutamylcyclotransferase (GGCT)/AIG2-like uncharacterized protein YtfP
MNLQDFEKSPAGRPQYYFAYGMLTDPDVMHGVHMVGAAQLQNYQFELLQYANVYTRQGSTVWGTLWQVDQDVIRELDYIEGYPDFYTRRKVTVTSQGHKYKAEVYTMTQTSRAYLVDTSPNQAYINKLVRGYQHAGLPLSQIQAALI